MERLERRRQIVLHKLALIEKCGYVLNLHKVLCKKGTRIIRRKDNDKMRFVFIGGDYE